jgi:hypothetical protein
LHHRPLNYPYPIQSTPSATLSSSVSTVPPCVISHRRRPAANSRTRCPQQVPASGMRAACSRAASASSKNRRRHRLQWLREGVGGVVVARPAHAAPPCAIRARLVLASAAQAVIAASRRTFSYPYRSPTAVGKSYAGDRTQRPAAGKAHIEGLTCSTIAMHRHHTFNATMMFSNFADMYLHQITYQNGLRRLRVLGQAGRAGRAL